MKNKFTEQTKTALSIFLLLLFITVAFSAVATESITYYHNDMYGSPIATTDGSGNIKWQEQYTAFGQRHSNDAFSDDDNIGFTGYPEDNDAGLSYAQARWYNPVLGRFTGIDPIAVKPNDIMSFNRYAYANNNPYKYIDPEGESPKTPSMAYWSTSYCSACYRADSALMGYARSFMDGIGKVVGLMGTPNLIYGMTPFQLGYDPKTVIKTSTSMQAGYNKLGLSINISESTGNVDYSGSFGPWKAGGGDSGVDLSYELSFKGFGGKAGLNRRGFYTSPAFPTTFRVGSGRMGASITTNVNNYYFSTRPWSQSNNK